MGPLEDCVESTEAEEMAEEVVELTNLLVLGEEEVGSAIQLMPTDDDNVPAQENIPESSN